MNNTTSRLQSLADSDISGIGVRISAYLLATFTVLVALTTQTNSLPRNSAKLALLTSFAINLTLCIGRYQQTLDPKNMETGQHLGLSLWIAGFYAYVIRARYHKLKYQWPLVVGLVTCFTLELAVGIFFGTMFESPSPQPPPGPPPPEPCTPSAWVGVLGVLSTILIPLVSIVVGSFPRLDKRPKLLWRWSVGTAIIWLLSSIIFNEFMVVTNAQFAFEASRWGFGQHMALLMVFGQILDVFNHLREPCRLGHQSRFTVFRKRLWRGQENDLELSEIHNVTELEQLERLKVLLTVMCMYEDGANTNGKEQEIADGLRKIKDAYAAAAAGNTNFSCLAVIEGLPWTAFETLSNEYHRHLRTGRDDAV